MPAVAGVSTNFTLSTSAPTQIALSNNGRKYGMLVNEDFNNAVRFAIGTNNGASSSVGHYLGPRRYWETPTSASVQGDISAIALSGTPSVVWIEE